MCSFVQKVSKTQIRTAVPCHRTGSNKFKWHEYTKTHGRNALHSATISFSKQQRLSRTAVRGGSCCGDFNAGTVRLTVTSRDRGGGDSEGGERVVGGGGGDTIHISTIRIMVYKYEI
jgi:hypothetical protein